MKYEARPIQKNKNTLKAESYEGIIKVAKDALIQDPSNSGYLIMEHVATLTTQVSVAVECHNNLDNGESNEVEYLFDPKPDDIPEPPEGFVYYGMKPVLTGSVQGRSCDIAFLKQSSRSWLIGSFGSTATTHYAISRLSPTFMKVMELEKKNKINQEK